MSALILSGLLGILRRFPTPSSKRQPLALRVCPTIDGDSDYSGDISKLIELFQQGPGLEEMTEGWEEMTEGWESCNSLRLKGMPSSM